MTSHRSPSPTSSITGKLRTLNILTPNIFTKGDSNRDTDSDSKNKDDITVNFFYRDKGKLRAYLLQYKIVFILKPSKFKDKITKVIYVAARLRGNAFY